MKSVFALGVALLVVATSAACERTPTAPSVPGQSAFATPVTGLWAGSLLLTTVSGGECVGAELNALTGTSLNVGTVTFAQTGGDVSAVVRSATTGLTCQYAGSAGFTSLSLSDTSCNAEVFYQCANGNSRVLIPIGSTITATQNALTASGVVATSYNVFSLDPDGERRPLTTLTTRHAFTAVRQ